MNKRRWYDQKLPYKEMLVVQSIIAVLYLGLVVYIALDVAVGQRRTTMMEQTINLLTHEVGDCRIHHAVPKS